MLTCCHSKEQDEPTFCRSGDDDQMTLQKNEDLPLSGLPHVLWPILFASLQLTCDPLAEHQLEAIRNREHVRDR